MLQTETWLAAMGFDKYEVSNLGRIRRRVASPRHPVTGRALSPTVDRSTGYAKVSLSQDGQVVTRPVHRLVCEAFHGRQGGDVDVRHLDGDKLNNAAENLCWGTRSENNLDAVAHGTNANTAKAACPLGHALQAPNLCSGAGRKCRACSLARAARQRADRRGNRFDFDAYADRSYCRILAGDVKVYARRAA